MISWTQAEESKLERLDAMETESIDVVDFDTLKLCMDNLEAVVLPTLEDEKKEYLSKMEKVKDIISQVS